MQDFTRHTYAVYAYCDYNSVTKCLFNRVGISLSLFIDRKEDFVQKARQKSFIERFFYSPLLSTVPNTSIGKIPTSQVFTVYFLE